MQRLQDENRLLEWPGSDVTDIHNYTDPKMPPAEPGKARVLGEYGGLGVALSGHLWKPVEPGKGYQQLTLGQLPERYAALIQKLRELETQGLSGSFYTQLSDVEQEQNGLMTYDREVMKIPVSVLARINATLTSPQGTRTSSTATAAGSTEPAAVATSPRQPR